MCFKDGKKLTGSTFSSTLVEGKKYLLKLIHASAGAMFTFMIDEHELEVIQTDLVSSILIQLHDNNEPLVFRCRSILTRPTHSSSASVSTIVITM